MSLKAVLINTGRGLGVLAAIFAMATSIPALATAHATITKVQLKSSSTYDVSGAYRPGSTLLLSELGTKSRTAKVDHAGDFTFRNQHITRSSGEFKVLVITNSGWFGKKTVQVSDDYNLNLKTLGIVDKQQVARAAVHAAHTKAAPSPVPKPTIAATPTPPLQATSTPLVTNLSNNNTYINSDGTTVHSPADSTNGQVPAGATAQCKDGTYSFSLHHSGTCSGHNGVAQWLD